jgi:predicted nucleic acid-binding protein
MFPYGNMMQNAEVINCGRCPPQGYYLPFDQAASGMFDDLMARRVRVAIMDLRIAAIALANNTVLLNRNVRDFGKVPGLAIEDWTA